MLQDFRFDEFVSLLTLCFPLSSLVSPMTSFPLTLTSTVSWTVGHLLSDCSSGFKRKCYLNSTIKHFVVSLRSLVNKIPLVFQTFV